MRAPWWRTQRTKGVHGLGAARSVEICESRRGSRPTPEISSSGVPQLADVERRQALNRGPQVGGLKSFSRSQAMLVQRVRKQGVRQPLRSALLLPNGSPQTSEKNNCQARTKTFTLSHVDRKFVIGAPLGTGTAGASGIVRRSSSASRVHRAAAAELSCCITLRARTAQNALSPSCSRGMRA